VTIAVVSATVAVALFRAFARFTPEQVTRDSQAVRPLHSPAFMGMYYVFVAVALWIVYATRRHESWYPWRVWVFGAVLAGTLISIVDLILPLHAFVR